MADGRRRANLGTLANRLYHCRWEVHRDEILPNTWLPDADHGCFLCCAAAEYTDLRSAHRQNLVIVRNDHAVCLLNRFPYNNGHLLVAPLRHVADLSDLTDAEHLAAMHLLGDFHPHPQQEKLPGRIMLVRILAASLAGVPGHLHWHLVPRWSGDTNFMASVAGIRVIPQSLEALWEAHRNFRSRTWRMSAAGGNGQAQATLLARVRDAQQRLMGRAIPSQHTFIAVRFNGIAIALSIAVPSVGCAQDAGFTGDLSDYHRSRLTHTLEVASIARTIGRELRLNEDLIEALTLMHDIGHPPFGHAGEAVLDNCCRDVGGFIHNDRPLRIATLLETRYPEFPGLNLTQEVLSGQALRGRRCTRQATAAAPGSAGRRCGRQHRLRHPRRRRTPCNLMGS